MIFRNTYHHALQAYLGTPLIKVITGMRRCGKTSFLKAIQDDLQTKYTVSQNNIVYINMENIHFAFLKNWESLHHYIQEKFKNIGNEKKYIFIDEVQEIEGWEKTIRSYAGNELYEIFITGSNSTLLSGELSSFLTGRYIEFPLYPLSFSEFLQFRGIEKKSEKITKEFEHYLQYGGLPGIHALPLKEEPVRQYFAGVFESILFRDIVIRYKIQEPKLLISLFQYLCDNIGNIVSTKKIVDFLKKERISLSQNTLREYLGYFETTFLVSRVKRFDVKGKQMLELYEKYYVSDLGMRSYALGFGKSDIGRILENIVFLELKRRGYQIFIGKIKDLEVDFVAEKNGNREYFQVSYLLASKEIEEREFRSLEKISDNYPKYVLSMDTLWGKERNGILQKNIIEWLLENSSL